MSKELNNLLKDLSLVLKDKSFMLSGAESCTGGMFSNACVGVSGASSWFNGSVVSYANVVKENVLNVRSDTLRDHGAVSEQCAIQMAQGSLFACVSDIAVSVTGVAGPSGGTPEKPVGTVFIAVASKFAQPKVMRFLFEGQRQDIREASVVSMVEQVLDYIHAYS